ncbi:MAG: CBS domain-containing protein [Saprospiraceae bacterium]|nr:CBS domain-containing protein [Saprospiraceae bacterium]
MVKSYRGVGSIKTKVKEQRVTVEDYMTRRLITFHPDQTMDQVIDVLLAKGIAGGPVIDDNKNLCGIISDGDCLKEVVKGKYNNSPKLSGKVSDHMATDVKWVSPEMNIFELAQMFLSMRLRRFPVLRDGKLIGQISQKDVMRAVKKLKNTTW